MQFQLHSLINELMRLSPFIISVRILTAVLEYNYTSTQLQCQNALGNSPLIFMDEDVLWEIYRY